MSADDRQSILRAMSTALYRAMPYSPKTQVIDNLRMIVERITFSDLAESEEPREAIVAEMEALFSRDLPEPLMVYLKWSLSRGYLPVLSGEQGYDFISHVSVSLSMFKEIEFMTAVQLSSDMQVGIATKIQSIHGEDTRVVFVIVPSLVAGFVVKYPGGQVDHSLSGSASSLIQKFIAATQPSYDYGRMGVALK